MSKLGDFLKSNTKKTTVLKEDLHCAFDVCEQIYKSTLGDPRNNEMEIVIGKIKDKDKFMFSLGGENAPYTIEKNHLLYLVTSLTKMSELILDDFYKEKLEDVINEGVKDGSCRPSIGKGVGKKELTPEEVEQLFKESTPEEIEDLKLNLEKLNDIKGQLEDFEQIMESMSDEEKQKLEKTIAKEREEMIYNKAKALEEELSGEMEIETIVERDYKYYKDLYISKGPDSMREELAKVDKDERKKIIAQVVEELKKDEENTKSDNQ